MRKSCKNTDDRSRKRGRRLAPLLAVLLSFACSGFATGQFFEFDQPTAPPELDEFTYCAELIGTLESEIAQLIGNERESDPVGRVVIRASVNTRIMAADLLAAGDAAGPDGSLAILYGLTIADGRNSIDGSLQQLNMLARRVEKTKGNVDAAVQQRFTESLRLVKLFNELAVNKSEDVRTTERAKLRMTLPTIFTPLGDAVAQLDQNSVISHWVPAGLVNHRAVGPRRPGRPDQRGGGVRSTPSIEELSRRVKTIAIRDDVREELEHVADFLRRGAEFPELRPRVQIYRAHIAQVLNLADALAAADWIDDATRNLYADRIKMGVLLFKDPRTRDRGQRYIDRLEASRAIIDRMTLLRGIPHDNKPDLQPLISAFLAADSMIENAAQAEQGRRQLVRLTAMLDRMIEYRELQEIELRRELKIVYRQLLDSYDDAERVLLEEIDTLSGDPAALADPAFASLMRDQKQYLEDLLRIRRVPDWVDQMTLIAPRSAGPFYAQARKMTAWLLDPNRRPDAIRAMQQFEQQLSLFYPLPFEQELAAGSPPAVAATGGLHDELLRHINKTRHDWAEQWGDGNASSDPANRLLLLYRLLRIMADTTEVLRLHGDASLLNRWTGWETTPAVIARAISDLPARLKLATSAAIDGNNVELEGNLSRIDDDMPLAKLMGRLTAMLNDALQQLPVGAASTCGQIIHNAGPESWFDERLPSLAEICRYALEQEYAYATGRAQLSGDLRLYVNDVAEDLLELLGERREPLPSLIGFDGSDPIPEIEMPNMRNRRQ